MVLKNQDFKRGFNYPTAKDCLWSWRKTYYDSHEDVHGGPKESGSLFITLSFHRIMPAAFLEITLKFKNSRTSLNSPYARSNQKRLTCDPFNPQTKSTKKNFWQKKELLIRQYVEEVV